MKLILDVQGIWHKLQFDHLTPDVQKASFFFRITCTMGETFEKVVADLFCIYLKTLYMVTECFLFSSHSHCKCDCPQHSDSGSVTNTAV